MVTYEYVDSAGDVVGTFEIEDGLRPIVGTGLTARLKAPPAPLPDALPPVPPAALDYAPEPVEPAPAVADVPATLRPVAPA